jgi:hypothetical protein
MARVCIQCSHRLVDGDRTTFRLSKSGYEFYTETVYMSTGFIPKTFEPHLGPVGVRLDFRRGD